MFLKVAPDLEDAEVEAIVEVVAHHGLAGVIVSNTTIARPTLRSSHRDEAGGLSGPPLFEPSTQILRRFRAVTGGRFLLIGAGGITSGADAYAKIRAGASAVQLYSALAYEGPGLVRRIKRDLAGRLRADGFRSVSEGQVRCSAPSPALTPVAMADVTTPNEPLDQPPRRRLFWPGGLSARLLVLTVVIATLGGTLAILPAMAAYEKQWLLDRVRAAELASLAAEVAPDRV
eukprot:gene30554-52710_t